jgi:hypothetical protein
MEAASESQHGALASSEAQAQGPLFITLSFHHDRCFRQSSPVIDMTRHASISRLVIRSPNTESISSSIKLVVIIIVTSFMVFGRDVTVREFGSHHRGCHHA